MLNYIKLGKTIFNSVEGFWAQQRPTTNRSTFIVTYKSIGNGTRGYYEGLWITLINYTG